MKKVVVIGAGAAGMMSAATAAYNGKEVLLLEKNHRVGRKIIITGKGRCNVTNNCDIEGLIENVVTNNKFLYSAFYTFTNEDVKAMFEKMGVKLKGERGSRVFPESNSAHDISDALEKMVKKTGVKLMLNTKVSKIIEVDNKIKKVVLDDNTEIVCDSVIIATGGLSYPRTGSTGDGYKFAEKFGHKVTDRYPSLIGLEVLEDFCFDLNKLSLRNIEIKLLNSRGREIYSDFGEMEFTEHGIDGPVIKSASCIMKNAKKEKYKILLDLKPALSEEKLDKRIQKDFQKYSNKKFEKSLDDLLPQKLIPVIIKLSGIDKDTLVHQISKEQRLNLVKTLKEITLNIKGYRPIEEAIVTSGGIKVSEINSSTMESKLIEGLFFAGEVIDVDAFTGGFNLQIAFSTAYLAGENC